MTTRIDPTVLTEFAQVEHDDIEGALRKLAKGGLTAKTVALLLGFPKVKPFLRLLVDRPSWGAHWNKGRLQAAAAVESALFRKACEGDVDAIREWTTHA